MTRVDKDGNKLFMADTGFYLKLLKDPKIKEILSFSGGKICKWLRKDNIMMIRGGMVGFNYHALKMIMDSDMIKDKNIYLRYGRKVFRVPVEMILSKKEFLHFKHEGFELQCFLPLADIKKLLYEI